MNGVEAVLAYANERYLDGWDVVVETYEDSEIAALVAAHGVEGALAQLADAVGLWFEAKAEAIGAGDADDDGGDDDSWADARDSWWDDASYAAYQSVDHGHGEDVED